MALRFEIIHNGEVVETREFADGSWKIGRSVECALQLKSVQVSKQHALLVVKGSKAAIVDLGSSNGIFINGVLVKKQRLENSDEVQIGDYKIRFAKSAIKRNARAGLAAGGTAGNAALAGIAVETEPEANVAQTPQEKLKELVDKKILVPFYEVMKKSDARWLLALILIGSLVPSVIMGVIPVFHWGKTITTTEALARAHVVIMQTVRENYRILSKSNDFTRLTVEACESEKGMLACYVIDPSTNSILAPAKLFNKSIVVQETTRADDDVYALLAIKKIKDKEEKVSIQKNSNTYFVAQPIYVNTPETNERLLSAIVVGVFEVDSNITSTFQPLVEAFLFAFVLALLAYFLIFKMMSYPISQMQEQLDAALKGENVSITSSARFSELENLAQVINFSISRLKQTPVSQSELDQSGGNPDEENQYLKAIQEMDQATGDALLVLDIEKRVRLVGRALEDLLAMRNQYASGQNISDACRDASFAGTAIDLVDRVVQSLGESQTATLDINGTSRGVVAVAHRNLSNEIKFVLIVVKMGTT